MIKKMLRVEARGGGHKNKPLALIRKLSQMAANLNARCAILRLQADADRDGVGQCDLFNDFFLVLGAVDVVFQA